MGFRVDARDGYRLESGGSGDETLLSSAVALYRGPFLGPDVDRRWAIPMQERLRSKFVRAVGLARRRARGPRSPRRSPCSAMSRRSMSMTSRPCSTSGHERAAEAWPQNDALKTYARCREALRTRLHRAPATSCRNLPSNIAQTHGLTHQFAAMRLPPGLLILSRRVGSPSCFARMRRTRGRGGDHAILSTRRFRVLQPRTADRR